MMNLNIIFVPIDIRIASVRNKAEYSSVVYQASDEIVTGDYLVASQSNSTNYI